MATLLQPQKINLLPKFRSPNHPGPAGKPRAWAGRGDGEVVCAAWRPDGGALACGLRGGGVTTFDGRTGRPVAGLEPQPGAAPVAEVVLVAVDA